MRVAKARPSGERLIEAGELSGLILAAILFVLTASLFAQSSSPVGCLYDDAGRLTTAVALVFEETETGQIIGWLNPKPLGADYV